MKKLTTSVLAVVLSSSFAIVSAQTVQDTVKTQDIEEVMVVGYSKVNRNEFVGTASQVNTKSIENKSVTNISQGLAGEVAGVRIINPSGQPGANASIRIRGFSSVNGGRDPLYILDGAPYEGNISVINPDDIESMTVLKDASATAIYGARGANGVIVINTKRGRSNRSNIQIESKIGANLAIIPRYDVIQSPEEYIGVAWQGLYNQGRLLNNANPAAYANNGLFGSTGINANYNMWNVAGANLIDPNTGQVREGVTRRYDPENWRDYAFKPGLRTENNLSMSGGSGKTTYYTSFGYLKDEGYSINSNFERYNTRLNLGFEPKSWLKGNFNMGYALTKSKNNGQTADSGSVFWFADNIPSIYPLFLKDANGNNVFDPRVGDVYDYGNQAGRSRGFGLGTNAIADAVYDQNTYNKHEINTTVSFEATITKDLTFETRVGGQYYNNSRDNLNNPFYGSSASTGGSIYKTKAEMLTWNWLQLLRYKHRFGGHGVEAFVAHESNSMDYKFLEGSKAGLVDPSSPEFNNGVTLTGLGSYIYNYRLESYFANFTYDYEGKYLLQASARRDGSSRFISDKWDTFGALGLGWVVSREEFMNTDLFPLLKLKTSYGLVGNQSLAGDQNSSYYPGYNVYDTGSMMGAIGASYNRYGYPLLTWEKSKKFQVGLEFALFKNKIIEGSVDYYNSKADNLIFDTRVSPSTSMAIVRANSGILVNEGVEFNVVGHIIKKNDFFLDLSINGEMTRNKLTEMPFDPATNAPKILDVSGEAGYGRAQGHSIYDYYMREWAGVNSQTGAGQWVQHFVDVNGNGIYDAGDQNILSLYEFQQANPNAVISQGVTENYALATQKFVGKSAIPDLRGAVNLSFGYKNFAIGTQLLYSFGGYSYDAAYASFMANSIVGNGNWHKDIHGSWKNPGDITDIPRLSNSNGTDANFASQSTRFLTKSDYLILNNVNVSYTFTKDLLLGTGINSLTISVAGDNLWLQSKRKGFNPYTSETGQSSVYNYAPLSTLTFGVKANF